MPGPPEAHPGRAAGSALGSLVPYIIGYKGGEAFVVNKVGKAKFDRIHGLSEKYGDLALIIPGMLPPPTPFKLFVFSAGVLEMSWPHFLLAVFTGRILRFSILAALTIELGSPPLPVPVENLRGRRVFFGADVKTANISHKPHSWNGVKVMLVVETPSGKSYPEPEIPEGSGDWKRFSSWVAVPDYVAAEGELNLALAEQLRAHNIEMPFPQREIRILNGNGAAVS